MVSTEVKLTDEQSAALEKLAKELHIPLADLILKGVDHVLQSIRTIPSEEQKQRARSIAGRFRSGLSDLSKQHDKYLAEQEGK